MPKKKHAKKKPAKTSHPLAGYKGAARISSSTVPSGGFRSFARAAAPAATKKAVAKAVKTETKKVTQAVKVETKKAVAAAVKPILQEAAGVVEKCGKLMKSRDEQIKELKATVTRCETAISLGNIGRGMRTLHHGHPVSQSTLKKMQQHGRERAKLKREIESQKSAAQEATGRLAKELHSVQERAKQAFMLGNIGRGMRTLHSPSARPAPTAHKPTAHKPKAHKPKAHKATAHHKPKAHKPKAHKPKHHPKPHHAPPMSHAASHTERDHRPIPTGRGRHVEHEANILAGVKIPGKGKTPRHWQFWQCAGPVRTGCGHSGSFVVGDHDERKGIRLRGVQPYPTHGMH